MKNTPNESFTITFEGENIDIHPELLKETLIYKIKFPDQRPGLFITAIDIDDNPFWTCIPEDKEHQQLAQAIGELLESKFNS
jgi:hypothetical protein